MAHANNLRVALYACAVTSVIAVGAESRAQETADTREELRALKDQNRTLQDQLRHPPGWNDQNRLEFL